MESQDIQPWWFLVEPLAGESISHFLGRFRRENELTVTMMGKITGLGGAIARWEKFRFIPAPTEEELIALSKVVQVEVERLWTMFPPKGVGIKHHRFAYVQLVMRKKRVIRLSGSSRRLNFVQNMD